MVPELSIPDRLQPSPDSWSRRRFLAGLGALGAGSTVAVGATAPTALPDVLTDEATKHYPTPPEVASHWRPTVTEAHAQSVVDRLATVTTDAEALWPKIETDRHNTGAGGWLESAREALDAEKYHEALFNATYGLQFAAEELGFARAKLGDADVPALAERALQIRDRCERVISGLEPYRVDEPGVDLAWYLQIEQETLQAESHGVWSDADAAANGLDDEDGPPGGEYGSHDVGQLTTGVHLGEVHAANAEHYWSHLQDHLGNDTTPYADHLRSITDDFRTTLEDRPSRNAIRERFELDDTSDWGPYEFAHSRLAFWCFDSVMPAPWTTDVDVTLRTTTAVALATGIVDWKAHAFATDHLVVDEADAGFDSGHVLAEKRRARATYQDAIGDDPDPLLAHQAGRAIEDLQVADVNQRHADDDWTMWRERLDAYLYALVGRGKLEHHPTYYQRIVDGP